MEHRRTRLYGVVEIADDKGRALTAYGLGILGAVLVIVAALSQYARTEIVPGVVATTQATAKVFAGKPGVLKKLVVKEGDIVEAGQVLATVSVDTAFGDGGHAAADGLSVLAKQKESIHHQKAIGERAIEQEKANLLQAVAQSRVEDANLASQAMLQTQLVASAEHLFELSNRVVGDGIVSRFDHERRRQAYLQESQKLRQIEQQRLQNATRRQQYEAQLQKLRIDHEKQVSELEGSLDVIEQQRVKLRVDVDYDIVSPVRGRVTSVQYAPGANVDTRVPLLVVLPEDAKFLVDAYAPSKAIGFVRRGQKVRLMYDAFPYQRFGSFDGTVDEISRSISIPGELDVPLKLQEAAYRVRITVPQQEIGAYGVTYPLQSGMTLKVSVVLERRSLFDRVLEPFHAVRARS